jgi:hypothetical protein
MSINLKLNVDEIDQHPIAVQAFKVLKQSDLIFPGSVVGREELERALEKEFKPGCWHWLGAFLMLKNKIESEGFFITQSDIEPPGFKILETEKMAEYCTKKLMKNLVSNYKLSYIMAAHDTSKLTDKQREKHKKVQSKAGQIALIQQKMLLDNSIF